MTIDNLIRKYLTELLAIPSPTGYTGEVVAYLCKQLATLSVDYRVTNRGAVIASVGGPPKTDEVNASVSRAIMLHVDTLGAMLSEIEADGTLRLAMLGSWSARFAEGARVSLISDQRVFRGTILPQKASGHVYAHAVDSQPVGWDNLRLRLDERIYSKTDVVALGIRLGDVVAVDSVPEFTDNGFINARHLDDKAAVAVVLAILATQAQQQAQQSSAQAAIQPCDIIFTVSEEIGTGAQHAISPTIKECLAIDISTADCKQNTCDGGVTLVYKDASGPYDRQLTQQLEVICQRLGIAYSRDVFRYYRSDASAAIEAGHDIRCALACFEVDGSHGYERTHMDSLLALASLLQGYLRQNSA
ncbi:osmoprotectant NAGGN system M42 family peptidase [Ostreibacterium oceani]|uniref:Osmoprotectant NAGGN system M42 family peptidase n=1 Tax=Ostreibacterium oceani TaxID=2654998 RepID=A0A6N7EW05_9GAMM|nr:osmoprotectant NAGGN system M42 family peptidase [Ostreibacterium oceani]MPV85609.1 osmoprotectant NAGGN system M42 family peptidase [Ostreibacterium oceani]